MLPFVMQADVGDRTPHWLALPPLMPQDVSAFSLHEHLHIEGCVESGTSCKDLLLNLSHRVVGHGECCHSSTYNKIKNAQVVRQRKSMGTSLQAGCCMAPLRQIHLAQEEAS